MSTKTICLEIMMTTGGRIEITKQKKPATM
jgi:hypothetical protein